MGAALVSGLYDRSPPHGGEAHELVWGLVGGRHDEAVDTRQEGWGTGEDAAVGEAQELGDDLVAAERGEARLAPHLGYAPRRRPA